MTRAPPGRGRGDTAGHGGGDNYTNGPRGAALAETNSRSWRTPAHRVDRRRHCRPDRPASRSDARAAVGGQVPPRAALHSRGARRRFEDCPTPTRSGVRGPGPAGSFLVLQVTAASRPRSGPPFTQQRVTYGFASRSSPGPVHRSRSGRCRGQATRSDGHAAEGAVRARPGRAAGPEASRPGRRRRGGGQAQASSVSRRTSRDGYGEHAAPMQGRGSRRQQFGAAAAHGDDQYAVDPGAAGIAAVAAQVTLVGGATVSSAGEGTSSRRRRCRSCCAMSAEET